MALGYLFLVLKINLIIFSWIVFHKTKHNILQVSMTFRTTNIKEVFWSWLELHPKKLILIQSTIFIVVRPCMVVMGLLKVYPHEKLLTITFFLLSFAVFSWRYWNKCFGSIEVIFIWLCKSPPYIILITVLLTKT